MNLPDINLPNIDIIGMLNNIINIGSEQITSLIAFTAIAAFILMAVGGSGSRRSSKHDKSER